MGEIPVIPKIVIIVILVLCVTELEAELRYTAVAPKLIQHSASYDLILFLQKITIPTKFFISMENNDGIVYRSDEISVSTAFPPRILKIFPKELNDIRYMMKLHAYNSEENITDETAVYTILKQRTVLLQTDKTIYKPEELIRFRVVILNRALTIYDTDQQADIYIRDPEKNLIKSWINATAANGIFSSSLKLSSNPLLGEWKLDAITNKRKESLPFKVVIYTPPKLNVEVKVPAYLTYNNSRFVAQIKANYPLGKAVIGKCVVTLRAYYAFDKNLNNTEEKSVVRTLPINGIASTEFDIVSDLGISEPVDREFMVHVKVTEKIGGLVQEESEIIPMFKLGYKMEMVSRVESYTPGFPFTFIIKVATQDDTPISDDNPEAIKVTHGFSYALEGSTFYSAIPANGLVNFTFQTPTNEFLTVANIDVTYKELTQWFPPPKKATSSSTIYLHITVLTEKPTADNDLEVMIQSNEQFGSIVYMVVSRGRIFAYNKVLFPSLSKKATFKIFLPKACIPTAHFLVASLFTNKNIFIMNSVRFPVVMIPDNYLTITPISDCEPGGTAKLQINTDPNSFVALRAVDQSVLEIKDDPEITNHKIALELMTYEEEISRRKDWNTFPAYEIIDDAGLIILTNSNVIKNRLNSVRFLLAEAPMVLARQAMFETMKVRKKGQKRVQQKPGEENLKVMQQQVPETWFWKEIFTESGNETFEITSPESLNSWIITGYSLAANKSITVAQQSGIMKTWRPFFISCIVPYSVVQGEALGLQILVHNFMTEGVTATVTLDNKDHKYSFLYSKYKDSTDVVKEIFVKAEEVAFIQFLVNMTTTGVIDIKITAVASGKAGNTISKTILVKSRGVLQRKTATVFISGNPKGSVEKALSVPFPKGRDTSGDKVTVTVIGDILGNTVENMNRLIRIPIGSGEQNMFNFVLDIVIWEYLNTMKKGTKKIEKEVTTVLEMAYQKQLNYKRYDGSYSSFGNKDVNGSTWMTAFVVRSLVFARPYITLDDEVITESLNFLMQMQTDKGYFEESGGIHYKTRKEREVIIVTAFTTLTLQEILPLLPTTYTKSEYQESIKKALKYLGTVKYDDLDSYTLNLLAYTLHVTNHANKDEAFKAVQSKGIKNSPNDDEMFWSVLEATEGKDNGIDRTTPKQIEATAYALMTYVHRKQISEAMPILKWLIKKMNPYGGFIATQDTIVGITALSRFSSAMQKDGQDMKIVVAYNNKSSETETFEVNNNNFMAIQEKVLPPTSNAPTLGISATGTGTAIVQLGLKYFMKDELAHPAFILTTNVTDVDEGKIMCLGVCGTATQSGLSNLILIEVTLPTGYSFESFKLTELNNTAKLSHHEAIGDRLNLYFTSLTPKEPVCFDIMVNTETHVSNHAPGYVMMYDYYESSKKSVKFYKPPEADLCKICTPEFLCQMDNCGAE